MATELTPIKENQRIWIMDALRGFAILGIFIANLGSGFSFYDPSASHSGPYFSSFDKQMTFLHHLLIEGKFYSIFSFLFGWGIALQLQRAGSKNLKPVSFVRRRLLFMFLLGIAHIILLWPGDIVAFYALVGFLLLWIRNWKEKTLLITAIILILSPILLYYIKMIWQPSMAPSGLLWETGGYLGTKLTGIQSNEEFLNYMKNANYPDLVKVNIPGLFFRYADLFFQSRISKVLGMFIVGYLIGREGRYSQILSNTKLLCTMALCGIAIGIPANYILAQYMENDTGAYYNLKKEGLYRTIAYAFGVAPLACAYISLFFLLAKTRAGEKILSVLRPVGKMAFSNYILQSIIGTITFLGLGFGMMGKVGPTYYTLFALIVFIFQILISKLWLRYFNYGPVEWLWRSFTYGKRQNFRKKRGHNIGIYIKYGCMYLDFKKISDHLLLKLEGLSPILSYHSVDHVLDVMEQAQQIAEIENSIGSVELILLKIASLYHDAGFLFVYKGHEEAGCELARNELPEFGLKPEEINQICGMIMATKIPQSPQNKLEEIICDADLDYLGRDDFFPIARRLYDEMLHYGFVQDEKSWNIIQKNFLQQHHYFTKTNQERRNAKKNEHLEIISKLLDPSSQ